MKTGEIKNQTQKSNFNLEKIASSIQDELDDTISCQKNIIQSPEKYINTGIEGFDSLLYKGLPRKANILLIGGPGSGKTIFCLQILAHHALEGKKCLFISFEESEERLIDHMNKFGWDAESLIASGNLQIKRYLTTDIYYDQELSGSSVQAMMAKDTNQYTMDLEPFVIGDEGYNPDIVIVDSLSAIASSFLDGEQKYRLYLDRLFRFFETLGSTNFLISERTLGNATEHINKAEEYLADGVIYLYNSRKHNVRESAIEILKMRGTNHNKKIVAMSITDNGIVIYPDQEAFSRYD